MKRITLLSLVSIMLLFQTITLVGCQTSNIYVIHEDINERPETKLINIDDMKIYDSVYVILDEASKIDTKDLNELPTLNGGYAPFQVDLRSRDLQSFDLSNYEKELDVSIFDNKTIWPVSTPIGFLPEEIMEIGKNPGLGIRKLHENGITGKGINIAIIDSALYYKHKDYVDNIKTYEFVHCLDETAQMHGSLVTSLLVGDSTGVAPEANVYYIASTFGDFLESGPKLNYNYIADGINRILDMNNQLPNDQQIKIVSISIGLDKDEKGYDRLIDLIDYAKDQGVFVVTVSPEKNFDLHIGGLSRNPLDDPDKYESYQLGSLINTKYKKNKIDYTEFLLVPMDNRTSANCTGQEDYQYFNTGGNSIIVPWIAGLYALCLQVEPELTIDEFINLAYKTAYNVELNNKINEKIKTKIFNPSKMISNLMEENKDN